LGAIAMVWIERPPAPLPRARTTARHFPHGLSNTETVALMGRN
jgi:hypothetical protein